MFINREGPTQSSIAKHFLECGYESEMLINLCIWSSHDPKTAMSKKWWSTIHRLGWWENLQEPSMFNGQKPWFPAFFFPIEPWFFWGVSLWTNWATLYLGQPGTQGRSNAHQPRATAAGGPKCVRKQSQNHWCSDTPWKHWWSKIRTREPQDTKGQ